MKKKEFPKLLTAVSLCVLGAAIGAFVMLYQPGVSTDEERFIKSMTFYVWLLPLMLSTAIMAVSMPVLINILSKLKSYFRGHRLEIFALSIVMVVVYILPLFLIKTPESIHVIAYHKTRMAIFLVLGLIVTLVGMINFWLVHSALTTEFKELPSENARNVEKFVFLRDQLNRILSILGILISLLVIATGAFRYALISNRMIYSADMPTAGVLAYGAYYTLILALAYIPTYLLLKTTGRRLCDAFFPLESKDIVQIDKWYQSRKNLVELLDVKAGVGQSLLSGIAILGPLLSGLISIMFES